ncbi:MAG TPA: HAMP domain-containing sensor histidine kinase [Chroococcales cyanobacterium]
MKIRVPLAATVLMLIGIPVCCEIAFVVMLTNLQQQAETEARRARDARTIADSITSVGGKAVETLRKTRAAGNSIAMWIAKGRLLQTYGTLVDETEAQYKALLKTAQPFPSLIVPINESLATIHQIRSILVEVSQQAERRNIKWVLDNYDQKCDQLEHLLQTLSNNQLQILSKYQRLFGEHSDERQAEIRAQILRYSLLAVAANAAFSLALAIFIVKNITGRLQVVNQNVRQLAENKPLSEILSGNDEIAELDRAFHRMALSLEEAARAKQEIMNMITHDLRSPLTAITCTLELISSDQQQNAEDRIRMATLARRNGTRMMDLINDLLDLEKINSGMLTINISDVKLTAVFESVRSGVQDWLAERGLEMVIADTPLSVKADENKLDRVLFNLISNAIKFSPKGGKIFLDARDHDGTVEITVRDQGRGIPPAMIERIFERFQQVSAADSESSQGSGLGLFICHEMVAAMGGKIWATSDVPNGSTFHFELRKA